MAFPVLAFGSVAVYDRNQTLALAERNLLATLATLHGHAEKVFQFQALALAAVNERLHGQSDEAVLETASSHGAYLRTVRQHADETLSIIIFGADGRPLVDSDRLNASEDLDVSDREYFRWHRDHPDTLPRVAGLVRSRVDSEPVFFVTSRRSAADGSFLGVITVGIQQSTFVDYWNRAAPSPNVAINLTREDGIILARRPAMAPAMGAESRLLPNEPLMPSILIGAEGVVRQAKSPLDGVERLVAYRRLGRFPVNITYGVPRANVLSRWRRRLMIYAGFAVMTGLALSSLALLARRRNRELSALNAGLERRVKERTAEIQASEARVRLLAQEVDHRAKNALAVVIATLRLTARNDTATYAQAVEGRVSALARVQTLLSEDLWRGASLHALLKAELAPFVGEGEGDTGPHADLDGPPVLLPPTSAQPLAMAVHELATNATKHGALSVPGGQVAVSWWLTDTGDRPGGTLVLRWAESGGPPVASPPARRGFGTRVLETIVRGQLGGRFSLLWATSGVICEIEVPLSRHGKTPGPGDINAAA